MSKSAYLKSIESHHLQLRSSWKDVTAIKFPVEYKKVSDVIISGMGASNFGYRVLVSAFRNNRLMLPVELVNGYDLPEFADEKTLFIATSYSGNTEEVLSALKEAKDKGCVIYAITSGGKLGNMVRSGEIPGYIFDTQFNPSNAPRTSIGYTIGATLGLLAKLGHLELAIKEFNDFVDFVESYTSLLMKNDEFINNITKKIDGKIPVFITSEHLESATHVWRNFLNETSKNVAFSYNIPAMNHHFLDGLKFPESARSNIIFVYVLSKLHSEKNKVRLRVSRDVNRKYGYTDVGIDLNGATKLKEIFELIILGSLISYKLAETRGEDPASNEMVDYLKSELRGV